METSWCYYQGSLFFFLINPQFIKLHFSVTPARNRGGSSKPLEKKQSHVFSCPAAVMAAAKGKRLDVYGW